VGTIWGDNERMGIMEIVQPIRDLNKIREIEKILRKSNVRNYIMFKLGIYSGLRISDILQLKVRDIRNQEYFILREQKTGKPKRMKIQPQLLQELNEYIKDKPNEAYLIGSQKTYNKPIDRIQAYRILNKAANMVGIQNEIGTHSMRKTFGYHFYKKYSTDDNTGRALTILQDIFNHSTPHVTLRYIGIAQDEVDNMIDNLVY
jgi:integrase